MMAAPATTAIPTATTAIAAPATTAMPMQMAPTVPSVVPAPMGQSFVAPQFAMAPPMSLTQGLVAPAKLQEERMAYEKALAAQLDKQTKAVLEESKIKQAMLQQAKNTQIAQFAIQAEEQCKMACLQVEREALNQVNGLKEAEILQRTSLEERAAVAAADYNKKQALEKMAVESYKCQKTWFDHEAKLMHDYQRAMQAGAMAQMRDARV